NGLLYVRKENIARTWPLQAVPERQANDIRKFEAIGTHPQAIRAGVAEALAFHQAVGAERKAARLRYLTLRWAERLERNPRIKIHSSLAPGQTWGLACVGIEGISPAQLTAFMFNKYRIVTVAIDRQSQNLDLNYAGIRVTPNIYTTLEEIDTFAMAMD